MLSLETLLYYIHYLISSGEIKVEITNDTWKKGFKESNTGRGKSSNLEENRLADNNCNIFYKCGRKSGLTCFLAVNAQVFEVGGTSSVVCDLSLWKSCILSPF